MLLWLSFLIYFCSFCLINACVFYRFFSLHFGSFVCLFLFLWIIVFGKQKNKNLPRSNVELFGSLMSFLVVGRVDWHCKRNLLPLFRFVVAAQRIVGLSEHLSVLLVKARLQLFSLLKVRQSLFVRRFGWSAKKSGSNFALIPLKKKKQNETKIEFELQINSFF